MTVSASGDTDDELRAALERHRLAFREAPYPPRRQRARRLQRLGRALKDHAPELAHALSADYGGRADGDSVYGDLLPSLMAIRYARRRLRRWMRPERRRTGPPPQPGRCRVHYRPLGVAGIVVPWNYPVYLGIGPLVAALAAGNRAMLKLSEFTPATNGVLRRVCDAALGDAVSVHEGDAGVARAFTALPFDHLLFTGSTDKGRQVLAAAADGLVPVTLELGGKAPVLLAPDAEPGRAAGCIVHGKSINAGQTCVAPDYVLCPSDRLEALVEALGAAFARFYPGFPDTPDYGALHATVQGGRLQALLDDARDKGARIVPLAETGGATDGPARVPLTLVLDATQDMRVMQEEIFGPILPLIGYTHFDEAIDTLAGRPAPLALYCFTDRADTRTRVLERTRSGGVCFNEVATHVLQEDLPFGGVGASGMGRYHGVEGFRTFSNARAVLDRGRFPVMPLGFPPYSRRLHRRIIGHLLQPRKPR